MKRKHAGLTLLVIVALLCAFATIAGPTKKKPPTVPSETAPIYNGCHYNCCGAVGGEVVGDGNGGPVCDFGDDGQTVEIMLAMYSECVSNC